MRIRINESNKRIRRRLREEFFDNIIFEQKVDTNFIDITIKIKEVYSSDDDSHEYVVQLDSNDGVRTRWTYQFDPTSYERAMEILDMCRYYIKDQETKDMSGYTLINKVSDLVMRELRDSQRNR